MAERGHAREADHPIGRRAAVDRFIAAVARVSQIGGAVAVALLLAAVLVICQMVFVRYVLKGSAIRLKVTNSCCQIAEPLRT